MNERIPARPVVGSTPEEVEAWLAYYLAEIDAARAAAAKRERLSEAAPELLKAAKAVAYSNGFDAAYPNKMEALRAAIAKATGAPA